MSEDVIVEVEGLYKIFGHGAKEKALPLLKKGVSKGDILEKTGCTVGIDNASFSVKKREIFVIMGLSGSGKSTVIRCVNRLIPATDGKILVSGVNVPGASQEELRELRRKKLSMVFQRFGLLPQRSVIDNVAFGLEIQGIEKEERHRKAREAINLVGLDGYETSMTQELSGGMQQRVGLARALANDPEILLMDEAFSALDPLIRVQLQDELLELQAKQHRTILFITHDLDEALKLGDRIAIMKDGAVVQIGTPEEILTRPADDYVKRFVEKVDRSKVITAGALMRRVRTITVPKDGPHVAVRAMENDNRRNILAVDSERRLQGLLTIDAAIDLEKAKKQDVSDALVTDIYVASPETPIADLLNCAMNAEYPIVIQDETGRMLGVLDRTTILAEMYEEEENEDSAATPLAEMLDQDGENTETTEAQS
ncbi:MAG: glycine betaine/L-proline ABC transporter ATP-binding protein [Opitutales bacterium]